MKTLPLKVLLPQHAPRLSLPGVAVAQELKIGYVNSERVLREAAPAKAAQVRLEAEFSKRERDLAEQGQRLKAAAEKLDKEAPTLSESERGRRQRELQEQDRDMRRKRGEFQEDLTQRKNEELAAVVERANRVIKQIFDPRSTTSSCRKPSSPGRGGHHRKGDQVAERRGAPAR